MQIEEVLAGSDCTGAAEAWRPYWEEDLATLPAGTPEFFTEGWVRDSFGASGMPEEHLAPLVESAARIAGDARLKALAWHLDQLLWEHLDYPRESVGAWPEAGEVRGVSLGHIYLLVLLDMVPRVRALHASMGIPTEVTEGDMVSIAALARHYPTAHDGAIGVPPGPLGWGRFHTTGQIFRMGRFQYMVRPFRGALHAFRRSSDGAVVALAADGARFGPDGFCVALDSCPPEQVRTARLGKSDGSVTGTVISPLGHALEREATLGLGEWREVLAPGDPVLETHIPPGGRMTPEAVRDSYERALEFFPRYFPDRPFRAIACTSWILNPELETILWEDNNCALWQRESYLFPIASGERSGLFHIFSRKDVDPATAPRATRLERCVADHLADGGRFIVGGMFFLPEDIDAFGAQPYRARWESANVGA